MVKSDNVNHPAHYTTGKIEVIDFIEDKNFDYHEGNAIKYISRSKFKKNQIEDLKKAVWYLNRKIWLLETDKKGEWLKKWFVCT